MLMKTEIDDNENKDQHILRAMLYETLMLLVRAENINDYEQAMNDVSISRYVGDFVRMVDAEYSVRHDVDYYANKLCITPNYLNKIIKQTLGTTAKVHIQKKVSDEAVRLLIYTSLTVTEIAEYLHFESSSYFVRFLRNKPDKPHCSTEKIGIVRKSDIFSFVCSITLRFNVANFALEIKTSVRW